MMIRPRAQVVGWMAAGLIALGIAKLYVMVVHPANSAEVNWRAASSDCAEQISVQLGGCGSCNGAWPQVSKCVMERTHPEVNSWIVDACIAMVRNRTQDQPLGVERVGPVVACSTRSPAN